MQVQALDRWPLENPALDSIAIEYVHLVLAVEQKWPNLMETEYTGPAAWRQKHQAAGIQSRESLQDIARSQLAHLQNVSIATSDISNLQRRDFLKAQLSAIDYHLRTCLDESANQGHYLTRVVNYGDEVLNLFGLHPPDEELADYQEEHLRLATALKVSENNLRARLAEWRKSFEIPSPLVQQILERARNEARERTLAALSLDSGEHCYIHTSVNQPYGAYHRYRGNLISDVDVDITTLPLAYRVLSVVTHEAYPGHHVFTLLREKMHHARPSWVEHSIYFLRSPLAVIAEGTAELGVELAFPDTERNKFEETILCPELARAFANRDEVIAVRNFEARMFRADALVASKLAEGTNRKPRAGWNRSPSSALSTSLGSWLS